MSDLAGNPENRFSRDVAKILAYCAVWSPGLQLSFLIGKANWIRDAGLSHFLLYFAHKFKRFKKSWSSFSASFIGKLPFKQQLV